MMIRALSFHSVTNQCSLSNHGVGTAGPPEFASVKLSREFWHRPGHVFPFINTNLEDYLTQLSVGPRRKSKPKRLVLAAVYGHDEPEKGRYDPCTHDELVSSESSDFEVSGDDLSQEIDEKFVETVPETNFEDPKCLLSHHNQELGEPQNLLVNLLDKLKAVHLHLLSLKQWNASRLKKCNKTYAASAENLIHYLALQGLDIQELKEDLSSAGLLNLETINSNVFASITSAIQILETLTSRTMNTKNNVQHTSLSSENKGEFTITKMRKKASFHADLLLGPPLSGRPKHIMVTVGKEATANETLISNLLKAGANIIRINCAHDDPSVWSEIIRRVKNSSQMLEKSCRILMDLAGPKLRTGLLKPGPNVMKISPMKDLKGDVIFPAQVWLSYVGSGPPPAHLSPDATVFLDDHRFLAKLEAGDTLRFSDFRGRRRTLRISQKYQIFSGFGFVAECSRTAYVESGTEFYIKGKKHKHLLGRVINVPPVEQSIRLRIGDLLTISREPCLDESGGSHTGAPSISCSSSRLFDSVKPGDPIAFDDGKIWGVIQGASISEIVVSVTHASPKGSKVGSEKSINIPKSTMKFEGLTSKDLMDLEFVAANADMVGISFIRDVRDVVILQRELEKLKIQKLGIVLKIETQSGFEKLPLLLLQAMQVPNPLGVMIARGDLAVECGWDTMALMQEEILSICGAAHVPVIWATQVLETLVKSGLPTRAEITDVANGTRANCIMLNKGKYIAEAVSTVDSIMRNISAVKNVKDDLKPLLLSNNLCQ